MAPKDSDRSGSSQNSSKKQKLAEPVEAPQTGEVSWTCVLPNDHAPEDATITMRHLIPEVFKNLPKSLASFAGYCNAHVVQEKLYEVQPLAIKGKVGQGEITSFKAPWEKEKCLQAVSTTGLYEAVVNVGSMQGD